MNEEIFNKPEKEILKWFIEEEMKKNHYSPKTDIATVAKKKNVFTCVFSVLNFVFISSYFFHIFKNPYTLGIINIVIYLVFMRKYNTMRYLMKEVKNRPDENIDYIISSLLSANQKKGHVSKIRVAMIIFSVLLPLVIFFQPHILYESTDEGYYVRFYTQGVIRDAIIEIPDMHDDEQVIGVRGDVFANLQGVEEIRLPDTITTIRGCAFANSKDLVTVCMPESLTYLGGEAFAGCSALENINLPDGILEIRGNTFEGCKSLEIIEIPESVTRIGEDAFRDCDSLAYIVIPYIVDEIGSSAFRDCDNLEEAYVPEFADVHEKAFKDSPVEIIYYE